MPSPRRTPDSHSGSPSGTLPDIASCLKGKHLLLTGATGFLGKAILGMLLDREVALARISLPIRPPSSGGSAYDRFLREIAASQALDSIRRRRGSDYRRYMAERINVVSGDVTHPNLGLTEDEARDLGASVDVVIHCAGLVDFLPSLDRAIAINVDGTRNILDLVLPHERALFVHVSTAYVCGAVGGQIGESLTLGDYPRQDGPSSAVFDAEKELARARTLLAQARADAEDPAVQAEMWARAGGSRHRARRLVQFQLRERLREIGVERAERWGWSNTYTYTKSIAERLVHATRGRLKTAIVRPAVVESSMSFPMPGWNQGGNTSSPLIFMAGQAHRAWPVGRGHVLDVIPVDYVAGAIIAIAARCSEREQPPVFHLGSSHTNPFHTRRVVELAALRYRRMRDPSAGTLLKARRRWLEPMPVSLEHYNRASAPRLVRIVEQAKSAAQWIADAPFVPPSAEPLMRRAVRRVEEQERMLRRLEAMVDQYIPFMAGPCPVFRTDNVKQLYAGLSESDRERFPYSPETIRWRQYWMDIHIPGLEKHAFPELRARLRAEAAYMDADGSTDTPQIPDSLLELLDEAADRHADRTALRWIESDDQPAETLSYSDWRRQSIVVSRQLRELGLAPGDRAALLCENRPSWGVAYFGILAAGATCVPLDAALGGRDAASLVRTSGAKAILVSRACLEKIRVDLDKHLKSSGRVHVVDIDDLMAVAAEQAKELDASDRLLDATPTEEPAPASIIFTSGTTGDPKGVTLTHGNFAWQVVSLSGLFPLATDDRVLSVLPLHHAFEFTCGFLLTLRCGAPVTYLREQTVEAVRNGLKEIRPTVMTGVPALWEAFWRQVTREVKARGPQVQAAIHVALEAHRALRTSTGVNLGQSLFAEAHRAFGGSLRFLVSGGAAISREVLEGLQSLGIDIYEGYGLTEAAPVVATTRPGDQITAGSVGHPLPGAELLIRNPDGEGVGEILVRSPGIMRGYWENPKATEAAKGDGWLHTGDLGRLDKEGRLYLVGRAKEVIVDPAGNTVYPEEVEESYAQCVDIEEIGVTGVEVAPQKEVVGALVVPSEDGEGGLPGARERILAHFREVDRTLPRPKRVAVLRFTTTALPRTANRKVKRNVVSRMLAEMLRPELDPRRAQEHAGGAGPIDVPDRIRRVVAQTGGIDPKGITARSHLIEDLGFDSLMMTELVVALESELGCSLPDDLDGSQVLGDLVRLTTRASDGQLQVQEDPSLAALPSTSPMVIPLLPGPLRAAGKTLVRAGRKLTYDHLFDVSIRGRTHVPRHTHMIVAANHSSHLDIGLVKTALGNVGATMHSLAARDYFFGGRWSRAWFENFTEVLPFEREGGVRGSLEGTVELVRSGHSVVIFPEGTRSPTGRMTRFRPGLGYLVRHTRTGILPLYLHGTHAALPKGASLPRGRELEARIGPFIPFDRLMAATTGLPRREIYRVIADLAYEAVIALRDDRRFDMDAAREHVSSSMNTGGVDREPSDAPEK